MKNEIHKQSHTDVCNADQESENSIYKSNMINSKMTSKSSPFRMNFWVKFY